MENSKAALNIWCSKKKLPINYDITGGADGFTCKVTVNSISYTANGSASSKKAAAANGAFAMLAYLINSKYLAEKELLQSCYEVLKIRNALFPGGVPVKVDGAGTSEQQPAAATNAAGIQVAANGNGGIGPSNGTNGNFAYLTQGHDPLVPLTSTPMAGLASAAPSTSSSTVSRHARQPRPGPYPLPAQRQRSGPASQCGSFASGKSSHSQQPSMQGEFAPAEAWDLYGPPPVLEPRPPMPLPPPIFGGPPDGPMGPPPQSGGLLPTPPPYYDDYSSPSYGLLPPPPGGPYDHYHQPPPQHHHDPYGFNDPYDQQYWGDNRFDHRGPPPPDYHHGNPYDNYEYGQDGPNGGHYDDRQQHYEEPSNFPPAGEYRQYKSSSSEEQAYQAQNGARAVQQQPKGPSQQGDQSYQDNSSRAVVPTKGNAEPIIGGYTLDNAKQLLHQFMQQHRIKPKDYEYDSCGPPHAKIFTARLKLFIPQYGREISLTEKAGNKQDASRLVALRIIQQLFREGLIEKYVSDAPSKRQLMKNCLIYEISISPSLKQSMMTTYSVVQAYNAYINPGMAMQTYGPGGTGYAHPPSEHMRAQAADQFQAPNYLYWCPPMVDLNPWTNRKPDDPVFAGKTMADVDVQLHEGFLTMIKNPKFQQILTNRMKLPIYFIKEQVIELTNNHPVLIIKGSTGCGKTTQVPQFILDSFLRQGNGSECSIVVTQPRRISAISISERVAYERLESLSDGLSSVGYSVRFDHTYPRPYGSILFCTTGHLLRRIQSGLKGISHLIIDEVHERDINTDMLLVIVRDLINMGLNLKVIVMSATMGVSRFQQYFNNCHVLEIEGTLFPVQRYFLEDAIEIIKWRPKTLHYVEDGDAVLAATPVNDAGEALLGDEEDRGGMMDFDANSGNYSKTTGEIMAKLREGVICFELILGVLEYIEKMTITGAVLIFLPGWAAIFELFAYLKRHPSFGDESRFLLLPLHSQLAYKDNHRVFTQVPQRKIILSTNIAETSITIDDVVFVIDTCLLKRKVYCASTNVTSYIIDWVSRANLQQRQGRAGRVRSGYFFALCSKKRFDALEEFKTPEILTTSLVETCLMIKFLGFGNVPEFLSKCIDRPSSRSVNEALVVLRDINAFDQGDHLTPLGAILVKLPIDPRLGRMVMLSILLNVAAPAITIAAASTTQHEIFDTVNQLESCSRSLLRLDEGRYSDHLIQFKVFNVYEKQQNLQEFRENVNLNAIVQIQNARRQLTDILARVGFDPSLFIAKPLYSTYELDTLVGTLVAAFYPNVCLHKEGRKILTNEEKVGLIHKSSVLYSHIQSASLSKSTSLKSPLFVYSEKSANRSLISSKNLSMVSFLQLLLFGVRRYEFPPPPPEGTDPALAPPSDTLVLDGWLEIRIDPHVFDCTWMVKGELEKMLSKVCTAPASLSSLTQIEETVLGTVKAMTSMDSVEVVVKVNNAKPAKD